MTRAELEADFLERPRMSIMPLILVTACAGTLLLALVGIPMIMGWL